MKRKILVTGCLGQIGTELVPLLRSIYGEDNVIASDLNKKEDNPVAQNGLFETFDATDAKRFAEVIDKHKINYVINFAAILSAVGEKNPSLLWKVNMDSTFICLELAKEKGLGMFQPSSIAAFGPSTPADKTPQDTIARPTTMYGISKVAGELLMDYYYLKYKVDTRGVRFPGLISYAALPGGGTTDYAVDIYYQAKKHKKYTSYIDRGTYMDMLYMPDALTAITQLIEADPSKLIHRNAFNITAMSFDPEILAQSIKKKIPEFEISYNVDPVRQSIAESWPNSLDDSCARNEWGWNPKYDLDKMTEDMLNNVDISKI